MNICDICDILSLFDNMYLSRGLDQPIITLDKLNVRYCIIFHLSKTKYR